MEKSTNCLKDTNQVFSEASGDFELMDRSSWGAIRGYTERNTYAHFDSVLIYVARKLGFKIHGFFYRESDPTVPYMIWHQGHEEGGLGKRAKAYNDIVTPFWKYFNEPLWSENKEDEWGMPYHNFDEVVWKYGVLQVGKMNETTL